MDKVNIVMKWPKGYPKKLYDVSWCEWTKESAVAGPYTWWWEELSSQSKVSDLFVGDVLAIYFDCHGVGFEASRSIIDRFDEYFQVRYDEKEKKFKVVPRVDEETKKKLFNEETWHELCGHDDKDDSKKLLKMLIEHLKDTYGRLIKEEEETLSFLKSFKTHNKDNDKLTEDGANERE